MVVVFNKVDAGKPDDVKEWLKDYMAYSDKLNNTNSHLTSLSRSLSLVLDEFYQDLNCVFVSSKTGEGFQDFFTAVEKARKEYNE